MFIALQLKVLFDQSRVNALACKKSQPQLEKRKSGLFTARMEMVKLALDVRFQPLAPESTGLELALTSDVTATRCGGGVWNQSDKTLNLSHLQIWRPRDNAHLPALWSREVPASSNSPMTWKRIPSSTPWSVSGKTAKQLQRSSKRCLRTEHESDRHLVNYSRKRRHLDQPNATRVFFSNHKVHNLLHPRVGVPKSQRPVPFVTAATAPHEWWSEQYTSYRERSRKERGSRARVSLALFIEWSPKPISPHSHLESFREDR